MTKRIEWRAWGDEDYIESAREVAIKDILIDNESEEDIANLEVHPFLFVSTDGTFGLVNIPTDSRVILATVERRGR